MRLGSSMRNRIYISVEDGLSEPAWLCRVQPFLQKILERLGFGGEEISIFFCGDAEIRRLNRTYRNIDRATDVLSFEDGGEYCDEEGLWKTAGDIALSLDTLPVNAEYFGVDLNTELKRLLIHGLLHLHGMDHGQEHLEAGITPECEMLRLQEKLLAECDDIIINPVEELSFQNRSI